MCGDLIIFQQWVHRSLLRRSLQQDRLRRRHNYLFTCIYLFIYLFMFCYLCRYSCLQCLHCLHDRSSYGNLHCKGRVRNLVLRHRRLHCILYHCDVMPRLCTKGLYVRVKSKYTT